MLRATRCLRVLLALSILAAGLAPSATAQDPPAAAAQTGPEVLALGTYHMSNPGGDVFNVEADDVLSATRQAEIAEVIAVLRRLLPTKIAVEAQLDFGPT